MVTALSLSQPRVDSSSFSVNSLPSHARPAVPRNLDFSCDPSRDSVDPTYLKIEVAAPGAPVFLLSSTTLRVVNDSAFSCIVWVRTSSLTEVSEIFPERSSPE